MKKFLLAAAAALCFTLPATAQDLTVAGTPNNTVVLNISSATTTKILSLSSARQTNVTLAGFTSAGAGTVKFEYGTKTTNECDTGTVALSGSMVVAAAEYQFGDGIGTVFVVPAGFDFCIVTASSATVVGFLDYNYQSGF